MSNKQARAIKNKVNLVNLLAILDNGSFVTLDLTKVSIVDSKTQKPIFEIKEEK